MAGKRGITGGQLKAEIRQWLTRIGYRPSGVYVQAMNKKWASCSRRGRLCFSTDLLREPRAFRAVVIVHEILHLEIPNHGKLFKAMMTALIPEWEKVSKGKAARSCGFH